MKRRLRKKLREESGQAVVEYILMMVLVMSAVMLVIGKLKKDEYFFKHFTEPLVKHVTYNYKYADATAQGWDEGNPRLHIQISRPNEGQTFRIFQPQKR